MIGSFPEEQEAYTLLSLLSSYLPLVLLVTSLLDLLIVWTYMSWFHPWKHILAYKVKEKEGVFNYHLCGQDAGGGKKEED